MSAELENGSSLHSPLQHHRSQGLLARLVVTFQATWDLGIVSFGGPPVHYQIFYRRFVQTSDERMRWADERMVSIVPRSSTFEIYEKLT